MAGGSFPIYLLAIASKESQSNISSNQFNWDVSQINVLSNKICRDVSINTFRNSLNEYRFQLEGLLDIVRSTRTESQTEEKPDKFSLEESSSSPLECCARRYYPWLPPTCQKQLYTSTAFPRKKIMKYEPFNSEYLHARHSRGSQSRDSPGPLDKQSWSGGEFEQIAVLLSPNLLKANHDGSQWLEILKQSIRLINKIGLLLCHSHIELRLRLMLS